MRRLPLVALVAFVVAAGAYLAFSPHLALDRLADAIDEGDEAKLREHVDFPVLRENLKDQLNSVLMDEASEGMAGNPLGALAIGLASRLVDPVVDSLVTPSGIAQLARGDNPARGLTGDDADDRASAADPSERGDGEDERDEDGRIAFEDARLSRDSLDRFSVWVPTDEAGGDEVQLVLHRYGLTWKLTNIVLPRD